MIRGVLVLGAALAVAVPAVQAAPTSPYAGQEARDIKALSPAEIEGYLAGEGSGFAKAAELNHYPGPAHVLELAAALALTPAQHEQTERVFRGMRDEAKRLGAELIAAEQALDELFARGQATPEALRTALARIGSTRTELRRVHLQAHLDQRVILTDAQVARYDQLRGYAGGGGYGHGQGHRH